MTTGGEKQYYALALLKHLFSELPSSMKVGIFCKKWGFLEEFLDHMVFAIAVFHAYGHQWPCQIIYHPWKCVGFGLTDGEGCEKFWSAIKLLIPSMYVSGYYHRLYSIDLQIKFLDKKSLLLMGKWMSQKWTQVIKKEKFAIEVLTALNMDYDIFRSEWKKQVKDQTKPLLRHSEDLANKSIHEIMALITSFDSYKAELEKLNDGLLAGNLDGFHDITEMVEARNTISGKISQIEMGIKKKKASLGIDGCLSLKKLMGNKFLQLSRLHDRKFELERLEQAYRHTVSNESKLHQHIAVQRKQQEPNISHLATQYNDLCKSMELEMKNGRAPPGAITPNKINRDTLFSLDIDDDIWQDVGLLDEEIGEIPLWLGNEDVQKGIKAVLEFDWCSEEKLCLAQERQSMQEWISEEWIAVLRAEQNTDNVDCKEALLLICGTWKKEVSGIKPANNVEESWGPTEEMIMQRMVDERTEMVNCENDEQSDGDLESVGYESENIDDTEIFEALESQAWTDGYHREQEFGMNEWDDNLLDRFEGGDNEPSILSSPKKQSRVI
ncbi:hypothetical protein BDQ12DRAFT_701529 [Crucibulum laeve]|uniref:Uncharacterized protein n=1 Tax=Crucibulum laeve TaxID=68775 RepID=A0A5C3LS15_9AGAR|nr:hypothetical protein BDQ12DRAFT_701529 [Crucibulum laeve]